MVTCFDIGGSYIRFAYPTQNGQAQETDRVPTPVNSWPEFVAAMRHCLPRNPGPAVISLAGAYNRKTGLAHVANIPCLDGRSAADDLNKELGIPIRIINDANAFALAEATEGLGTDKDTVFAMILGSGVGGGIVHKGTLLEGHGGVSGEWGHGAIIDPSAGGSFPGIPHIQCGCGQIGCIDAYCSARGMEKLHKALHEVELSSIDITSAWHSGDLQAAKTIDAYVTLLSRALSMIVNLLGPDIIPVSGGLSSDKQLLYEIDQKTRALALGSYDEPLVVRGTFAENGGLQGAYIFARKEFPQAFA